MSKLKLLAERTAKVRKTAQTKKTFLLKMNERKPCYIWDEKLIEECDRLPAVIGRASLVHNLVEAYDLLNRITVVRSSSASYEDMKEFHSEAYLDHLKLFTEVDDDYISNTQDEEYGIGYDCPPLSKMFELVSTVAGGSITAARCLMLGIANVAINWCGGWHHAHRFGAEGFCYVNDIVIAIEKLKKKFPKVLYIDLDVHHGNGVQNAYSLSKSVFTLSFHKFEPGFYPGTGSINDIGTSGGSGYTCNFPFHAACSDDTMVYAFDKVFNLVYDYFKPDVIVTQCGADALARDPNGGANLTIHGYSECVRRVLDKRKPTMLLGGGGYKHPNAARLWASLTALVVGVELDEQIPEHGDWPQYGPDYTTPVEPTLTKDSNKNAYIDDCINKINCNLEKYLGQSDTTEPETKRIKTNFACLYEEKPTDICNKRRNIRKSESEQKKKIFTSGHQINMENNFTKGLENIDDVYAFVD